jgi:AmmeMemoRadiSam system protein B
MNIAPDYKPKLRNVEPFAAAYQGRNVIGLKDPLRLSEKMVFVPHETLPLLALFDGAHTLRDIQAALTARAGRIVFLDEIQGILDILNQAYLLEGPAADDAVRKKTQEYRDRPFRPASHAGISYSDDPEKLTQELDAFFDPANGGPGKPDLFSQPHRPVGLVAPHIDIRAGGLSFARAYHALATGQPSDVYVILGTGHAGVQNMFTAGTLDFQTPLGTAKVDSRIISLLSKELGKDAAEEEILHETEHVIEFQVVFLQHLFRDRHDFTIVPVLCSLSHRIFDSNDSFSEQKQAFYAFCSALRNACRQSGKTVCFIASADLDHIGPRYGDQFVPHQAAVNASLEKDGEMLGYLRQLSVDSFIRCIASEGDARRVCGFSPIVTMMHAMEASRAETLSLDFAYVDDRKSFVTFGAMVFY